jgi:hypothetical protein
MEKLNPEEPILLNHSIKSLQPQSAIRRKGTKIAKFFKANQTPN